jgi:hypothetical protein
LQWAEQLQQQGPKLVPGTMLEFGGRHFTTQIPVYQDGAAVVCIPRLRVGPAIVAPADRLDSMAGTVSEWVGGIDPDSAAYAQLEAAGCSPQQLLQQLGAMLSAQQGTQQGQQLSDASLAALVQQLQAVGVMLCSISVPHFCNNPACVNLSGPTEVRLVSGRS